MADTNDIINARKARYLTVVELVNTDVIDAEAAKICLKGNLDPDDDETFYDDSNLPVKNIEQGLFIIDLSREFIL